MSIDINWETLTTGPDGESLAESIRSFIHDRFQQITLPRFIKSVHVHKFDFGTVTPDLVIKDICNPLPDFYEDEDEDGDEQEDGINSPKDALLDQESIPLSAGNLAQNNAAAIAAAAQTQTSNNNMPPPALRRTSVENNDLARSVTHIQSKSGSTTTQKPIRHQQSTSAIAQDILSSSAPPTRTSTPRIPGGTSNLSYFHWPLGVGLSANGTSTPLAAVSPAFGNFPSGSATLPEFAFPRAHATKYHDQEPSQSRFAAPPDFPDSTDSLDPRPEDLQIVAHLRYSGDVRLSLTAEILLDFPSPGFVGIPLGLNVTGMSFDGIVLLAYLRGKVCFSFLDSEDGNALLGGVNIGEDDDETTAAIGTVKKDPSEKPSGGLFEEIKVESEIGQKQGGRQVLKNVGKVEKFILEEVRKIFEQEVVYPSFWTFLV